MVTDGTDQPGDSPDEGPDKPLEKAMDRFRAPFAVFLKDQTTSSLLLFSCTLVALWLANSGYAARFDAFLHAPIGFYFNDFAIEKSVNHWINDALMPLFFFVLGLEIKREILAGEFQDLRRCLLVVICALGGMLVPALLYLGLNPTAPEQQGWGIPMATDTAFALGALVIFGKRLPAGLITLLVAIAIVDDIGAVLVIALFYTQSIDWPPLGLGALALVFMLGCNALGIRRAWPYGLGGLLLWAAFLSSGVHTTVAGVLAALTVPARPKHGPYQFMRRMKRLLKRFERTHEPSRPILADADGHRVLEKVQTTARLATTPLQRWELALETPIGLFVLPVFALANAGIPLSAESLSSGLAAGVSLGIMMALVLGKFVGITGGCLLATRCRIGQLPEGVQLGHVAGMALVAGMGFTMSMFIAALGFSDQPELLNQAKVGILGGSLIAGLAGIGWLAVYSMLQPVDTESAAASPEPDCGRE